jgi:hypothetical protein
MTEPFKLTWWEADELLEHMKSRDDLWIQSSDNEDLWIREEPRSEEIGQQAFGLLILRPIDKDSPFRMFGLQPVPMAWDPTFVDRYLFWLVRHWTSFRRRDVVSKFLTKELLIPVDTSVLAAIAIEGLAWEEDETPEPPDPPLQEEMWPEMFQPPTIHFEQDRTLIGTFLLSQNAGWVQLRLTGGMIKVSLSLQASKSFEAISLQGLVRPLNGRVREAASKIAGWPTTDTEIPDASTQQQQLPSEP